VTGAILPPDLGIHHRNICHPAIADSPKVPSRGTPSYIPPATYIAPLKKWCRSRWRVWVAPDAAEVPRQVCPHIEDGVQSSGQG
jgi:hypothetical protein